MLLTTISTMLLAMVFCSQALAKVYVGNPHLPTPKEKLSYYEPFEAQEHARGYYVCYKTFKHASWTSHYTKCLKMDYLTRTRATAKMAKNKLCGPKSNRYKVFPSRAHAVAWWDNNCERWR
jgi:hypothetical protein